MKPWMGGLAAVAGVLVAVAIASGGGWVELLGATAVTLSFAHAQVADRLAEVDAAREVPAVDCNAWATRYLLAKEVCWCGYFVALGAWSALVGVGMFLTYPVWRRWWRARRPVAVG